MPSSQTEPERLAECYSEAYTALLQGHIEQAQGLLDSAEELVASIDFESLDAEIIQQLRNAHGRLMSAAKNERDTTGEELNKLRRGKKSLKKMRFRTTDEIVGSRVYSEA